MMSEYESESVNVFIKEDSRYPNIYNFKISNL